MRIGLIGAGHMAAQHAAAYASFEDVEVVGVAGRGRKRAAELARTVDAESTTVEALLGDEQIEAVDVTVPTRLHPELCIAALRAGKHVFCENPLAQTAAEGEQMLEAARAAKRHLQVALMMRFARPATDLVDLLERNWIGDLQEVTLARLAPGTSGEHHGDPFEELMLFDLDTLTRCLGTPDRVQAKADPAPDGDTQRGRGRAMLRFGDVVAKCVASFLRPADEPFVAAMEATFDGGRLDARFTLPVDAWPSLLVAWTSGDRVRKTSTDLGPQPIVTECRRFTDVVHGKADPALLDASEAVKSLRVLDALRVSVAAGGWVEL